VARRAARHACAARAGRGCREDARGPRAHHSASKLSVVMMMILMRYDIMMNDDGYDVE